MTAITIFESSLTNSNKPASNSAVCATVNPSLSDITYFYIEILTDIKIERKRYVGSTVKCGPIFTVRNTQHHVIQVHKRTKFVK